jgi:membrane associated rhomboid family serine protease
MARTAVLGASLAIIGLLAVLTTRVAIREGVDLLVVISFLLLIVLGIGVVGALSSPPPDE